MYFLDSCICIDFMRGKLPYGYSLLKKSNPSLFGIPSIVEAELRTGVMKSENIKSNRLALETFLAPFKRISFDANCAMQYAKIRSFLEKEGVKIGPNDTLIAATALAHNAVLVTQNTKGFERVPGLELESWYEADF